VGITLSLSGGTLTPVLAVGPIMQRRALAGVAGLVGLLLVAVVVLQTGLWVDILGTGEYEEGTVTVRDGDATPTPDDWGNETAVAVRDGEPLATVEVRIADDSSKRILGLSNTSSLGPDEGMLFVHEEEQKHTYVMRDMDFDLDIIFIAENRTITRIHHAPAPPEGESYSEEYSGQSKYVLEVNRGWANETGVSVGDRVELPESVA